MKLTFNNLQKKLSDENLILTRTNGTYKYEVRFPISNKLCYSCGTLKEILQTFELQKNLRKEFFQHEATKKLISIGKKIFYCQSSKKYIDVMPIEIKFKDSVHKSALLICDRAHTTNDEVFFVGLEAIDIFNCNQGDDLMFYLWDLVDLSANRTDYLKAKALTHIAGNLYQYH